MASLQGKLVKLEVGGKEFECELEMTLNFTANTSEEAPCKPISGAGASAITWVDPVVNSKGWDATVSAKTTVDALTVYTGIDKLMSAFISSNNIVTVTVETNSASASYDQSQTFLFTGQAIMSGLTLNAGQEGAATGDVTFTGKGAPTYTQTTIVGG